MFKLAKHHILEDSELDLSISQDCGSFRKTFAGRNPYYTKTHPVIFCPNDGWIGI